MASHPKLSLSFATISYRIASISRYTRSSGLLADIKGILHFRCCPISPHQLCAFLPSLPSSLSPCRFSDTPNQIEAVRMVSCRTDYLHPVSTFLQAVRRSFFLLLKHLNIPSGLLLGVVSTTAKWTIFLCTYYVSQWIAGVNVVIL